jgi:hypothetical protein
MTWWNWSGRHSGEREGFSGAFRKKKRKEKRSQNWDSRILKIWKFGGYITKIETLEVELKLATNFGG